MRQRVRTPLAFFVLLLFAAAASFNMNTGHANALTAGHQHVLPLLDRHPNGEGELRYSNPYGGGGNLLYQGGPVMAGTAHIYTIFWEPRGNVASGYNGLIRRYFRDVGKSSLYRVAHQYTQSNGGSPSNSVLSGSWVDTRSYPESPLLDSDIQNEVTHAQRVNKWHSSMHNAFFVFIERHINVCIDSSESQCVTNTFCAYHSAFGSNTIYATMPYMASFSPCSAGVGPNHNDADQTIDGASHEQIEAATDPFGNAWLDTSGSEIGDKCERQYGSLNAAGANVVWHGHPYRVQKEWDNRISQCSLKP